MSSQDELDPRFQEAINAALVGEWQKAAELNSQLFDEYPEDVNVLNRLGHAYSELGQVNKASSTFKKVLELDPYNPIAKKNIDKLSTLRGANLKPKEGTRVIDVDMFLEEPGKTKTIEVVDLAMPRVLIQLRVGDTVLLNNNKNDVSIVSEEGKRLGKLESSWGNEISSALSLGSDFSAIVKAINVGKDPKGSTFSVFVRETKRSKKIVQPIFPIDSNFTPFVREETVSYIKEEPSVPPESGETAEADSSEELPKEDLPQEANELLPEPELVEDEEEYKEIK
ncbi:MAG TPA: tetratricopeptide repeat protein [Candidatus Saccharimonadales bacterium]|nr:tetratricopeptide repeat protein [Candidatus Saccharimonadales bacterium]